jgi:hypothetical protein
MKVQSIVFGLLLCTSLRLQPAAVEKDVSPYPLIAQYRPAVLDQGYTPFVLQFVEDFIGRMMAIKQGPRGAALRQLIDSRVLEAQNIEKAK